MFDARTINRLEKVFDLQMWAFGCDARCAQGNLFAARGMARTPPAPGTQHSSTWSERWRDCEVELSTLGLRLRRGDDALFLQRGPLQPQLKGVSRELLALASEWVLAWEAFVDAQRGPAWRAQTLRERQRPAPFDVEALRAEWRALMAT